MTPEDNEAVVRRQTENAHREDLSFYDEIIAPGCTFNGRVMGPEGMKTYSGNTNKAFPDRRNAVVSLVGRGDMVGLHWAMTGTHTGTPFMTPAGVALPPSGRAVKLWGVDMYRLDNGKIVEHWSAVDRLDWYQQLGILPPLTDLLAAR